MINITQPDDVFLQSRSLVLCICLAIQSIMAVIKQDWTLELKIGAPINHCYKQVIVSDSVSNYIPISWDTETFQCFAIYS